AWAAFAAIISHGLPEQARRTIIIATAILVAFAVRGAAHRMARPIERLTEATRRFGAGELSYRLPEPPPWFDRHRRRHRHRHGPSRRAWDEILELHRSWNEMAERIERLVRGQKELLASVSHDLRSPLARVRVALELIPREGGGEAHFA